MKFYVSFNFLGFLVLTLLGTQCRCDRRVYKETPSPLKQHKADTYFKSKSYQGMVIMNGSGEPISEKKMSAFSVEDHKDGDE